MYSIILFKRLSTECTVCVCITMDNWFPQNKKSTIKSFIQGAVEGTGVFELLARCKGGFTCVANWFCGHSIQV